MDGLKGRVNVYVYVSMSMIATRANVHRLQRGIFRLKTRRLGTLAEILVKKMIGGSPPRNRFHDMTGTFGERIEVKFATVLRKEPIKIHEGNVLQVILQDKNEIDRAIAFRERTIEAFDCNIQQVKCAEFDILWYGLFFKDGVAIFAVDAAKVPDLPAFCEKQHKGNKGEGQFHINGKNIQAHVDANMVSFLSYNQIFDMLVQN